jgi:hypothetical protein
MAFLGRLCKHCWRAVSSVQVFLFQTQVEYISLTIPYQYSDTVLHKFGLKE